MPLSEITAPATLEQQPTHRFGNTMKQFAGRIGVCLALATGGLFAIEAAAEPDSASAATAQVGMPFTGQWAYNTIVQPDASGNYNDSTSSHPSVHHKYYGDWATDLYAAAGTNVKLNVTSKDGPVTFTYNRSNDSCSSAGPNIAGHGVVLNVLVNGTSVGSIDYEHLDDIASGPYTNGMTIGKITSESLDANCYSVRHTHVELKNSSANTYSCWSDYGNPGTSVAEGSVIGVLGSNNNGAQQKCAVTNTPPPVGPTFMPTMVQRPSGETDVSVVGPGNSLDFYYNAQGSTNWGKVTVPSAQAYSTPAVVQRSSGETDIAVEGPNNSLDFYYNAQGSPNWGKITVAGAGTTFSAPSVIQRPYGETDIAVQGPNNQLAFYYNAVGSPIWGGGTIPGTQAYSTPAIAQRSSGETDVAVQGADNSLNMYFNAQGSTSWGTSAIAVPGYAFSAPSIIQRPSGETDIAVQGPGNSLDFYFNTIGSLLWGHVQSAGNGTTYTAPNAPLMVQRTTGESDVAVKGPGDSTDMYFNAQGSTTWGKSSIAVPGYGFRAPAIVQRPNTGETDVAVVGPSNRLDLYLNTQGGLYWGWVAIAGANSAS